MCDWPHLRGNECSFKCLAVPVRASVEAASVIPSQNVRPFSQEEEWRETSYISEFALEKAFSLKPLSLKPGNLITFFYNFFFFWSPICVTRGRKEPLGLEHKAEA